MANKVRRYDLDWLRVLVFGLLVFYHVGMFFVPWPWHIKNNVLYDWLQYPMLFANQCGLAILFVISGMGTCFALAYRSGKAFRKERLFRLGIPLLLGIFIIVPPQVYIERLVEGQIGDSYLAYYFSEAFNGIYPPGNITWHHLWFLPYLLIYSLILSPVFIYLRNHPKCRFMNGVRNLISKPYGLFVLIIPLYLTEAFIEPFFPVTHALIDDWFAFTNFLILFFYGFLLISVKDIFDKKVDDLRGYALGLGILSFTILLWLWQLEDSTVIHFTEAFFKVLNFWSWIIAIFGFAARYFNHKSNVLKYCNEAVYPFYILHQTVTIVLAYFLMEKDWGLGVKFMLLTTGTFFITWLIYECIIRRVSFLRLLFGLKNKRASGIKVSIV